MNLVSTPISQLATVQSGAGAPQDARAFTRTGFPFVRAGSLSKLLDGAEESSLELIEPEVADEYGLKLFPAGTVLFAKSGMSATKGHVYRLKSPAYVVNHLAALVPHKPSDSAFLAHALQHYSPTVLIKDSAYPSIRLGDIENMRIQAPSSPRERERIAEILDKADALRAKRRAALAQLDTLTQSIFLDMFGDPVTNPKGWPIKRIADITECLDRLRRPVTESDRKPGNVPYYGANGQQGWIDTALFDEPLVLVAEDGGYFDAPERGVAYRIDGPAWVNNHAHILRALPKYVETEFLHRALRHFNFLPYISGTTRAKLTQGQLNAVKLFVPPLELQRTFGERVASVQRVAREAIDSGEQLDALFASLQYRAFRGDLHLGREQPTLAMMG